MKNQKMDLEKQKVKIKEKAGGKSGTCA